MFYFGKRFDYIISSYEIRHIGDDKNIEIIKELYNVLDKGGRIVIGNIEFQSEDEFKKCREKAGKCWDYDEIYIIVDLVAQRLKGIDPKCRYKQISACVGVLQILKG